MVDTPKKPWFNLITPDLLNRVGGVRSDIDPRAADELAGDKRHRFNPLAPTQTIDRYAQAENATNVHRRR